MKSLIQEMLMRHEGFRGTPYLDTKGNWTIGYGRHRPITEEEGRYLLDNDIELARQGLPRILPCFARLSEIRQSVLIDMYVNMGMPRLRLFVKTLDAVECGDWGIAADEMLDSRWARELPNRAGELSEMMRTNREVD